MSDRTVNVNYSFGPLFFLTMVLIILKVNGNIDWDWLWVLAPMWLPAALVVGFFAAIVAMGPFGCAGCASFHGG